MHKVWKNWIVVAIFGLTAASLVEGYEEKGETPPEVIVGRYSTSQPVATPEQTDILQTVVMLQFPQKITTVGEALEYLLLRSGYRMAKGSTLDPGMPVLLTRPLPEVHRTLGPITLEEALRTLAGHVYRLAVDPLNRLIAFDLKDKYRSLLKTPGPSVRPRVPSGTLVSEQASADQLPEAEILDSKLYGTVSTQPQNIRTCTTPYHVQKNEILFDIARNCAKQQGVGIYTMAYGLYEKNPQAFGSIGGKPNVHLLKAGRELQIPTATELAKLSKTEAIQFWENQQQLWKQRKSYEPNRRSQ